MDDPDRPSDEPPRAKPHAPSGAGPSQTTAHPQAPSAAALEIDVIDAAGALPPAALAWVRDRLRDAARQLSATGEFRVRLVRDDEMASAHERYSGVSGTTDVLTFDLTDGGSASGDEPVDADALVCVDVAARSAGERGIPPERETLLYALHALLHCLGHDDLSDDAYERMHAEEDRLLEAIGVGRTFRGGHEASDDGAARGDGPEDER